jgi:outer membrane protein assembly factor BamD (BamD/ComL family)
MRDLSMMMRAFLFLSLFTITSTAHAAPELAEKEAAKAYDKARACYSNLMLDEPKQKLRGNWEKCMSQFAAIARDYNETTKGPDALFTLAKMYRLLGQESHSKEDAKESYDKFDGFTDRYKKSRYYDDALYEMACIKLYTFGDSGKAKRLLTQIIRWDPDGDRVNDAKTLLAKIKSGKVKAGEPEPMKPQGALVQPKVKSLDAPAIVLPPPAASPTANTTPAPTEKKSPQP